MGRRVPLLAPRRLGIGFGLAPREGGRLPLVGPPSRFQLGQGFLERRFQFRDALFQSGILGT